MLQGRTARSAWLAVVAASALATTATGQQMRLTDDFEHGLGQWDVHGTREIVIVPSGAAAHGHVLELRTNGWDIYALARGSAAWGGVRVDGEVLFRPPANAYLGMVYHYREHDGRVDFGNVYIKGNGSYLRANPHRDGNVGRTLYEEYRTPLTGDAAIVPGAWQRFRLEVVGSVAHVYIGDLTVPQLTFRDYEGRSGAVGFQPRSVGDTVWLDNIVISSIDTLSYQGPDRPAVDYAPDSLLTAWAVAGPLEEFQDDIARAPDTVRWRPFAPDRRGAVITASVVDYAGARTVAYFRTMMRSEKACSAVLHLSTVDDLAVWVNRRFWWFVPRGQLAWYDFWRNPEHAGRRIPVRLVAGENEITIRVRGGVYASGGFFARLEDAEACGEIVSVPPGVEGPRPRGGGS